MRAFLVLIIPVLISYSNGQLFTTKNQLEHLNNFALLTNVSPQNDKSININNLRSDISNYISRNIFDNAIALSSQSSPLRIHIPLNGNEVDPLDQPNSNTLEQTRNNQLNQQQHLQFLSQNPSPYLNQQIQSSPYTNQQIQKSSPYFNSQDQSQFLSQQSLSPYYNSQQAQSQILSQPLQSGLPFENEQFQTQQLNNQISQDQVIVPKPYAVRIPHPVPVPVHIRIPVPVDRPYAVQVTKTIAVPVEKPVYIKVPQPIEVPVAQPYPVSVPQTVEVKVPYPVYVRSSNGLPPPEIISGKQGIVSIQTDSNPVTASSKKVEVSTTPPVTTNVKVKSQEDDSKDRNKRIPEGVGLVPPFYTPQFSDDLLSSYVGSRNGGVFGLNKYQTAQYQKTW